MPFTPFMHTSQTPSWLVAPPRRSAAGIDVSAGSPRAPLGSAPSAWAVEGFDGATAQARAAVAIQVATAGSLRLSAARLLERRYRSRGYGVVPLPPQPQPRRNTFTAVCDSEVIGTLTVGLDRPGGLACDTLFGCEIDALRMQGLQVCEFKRLAVDSTHPHHAEALTRLFHEAFVHARFRHRVDVVLTEVNPRHVGYYAQRFGARALGRPRRHAGVGATAVLLMLDLAALEVTAERLASAVDMPRRVRAEPSRGLDLGTLADSGPMPAFSAPAAPARSAPVWRN